MDDILVFKIISKDFRAFKDMHILASYRIRNDEACIMFAQLSISV